MDECKQTHLSLDDERGFVESLAPLMRAFGIVDLEEDEEEGEPEPEAGPSEQTEIEIPDEGEGFVIPDGE